MTQQNNWQEANRPVQRVILITNPGAGVDSELALVLAAYWHRQRLINLEAVVANQAPVGMRAALAKATLEKLGASDVPVYAGTNTMHVATGAEKAELQSISYLECLKLPPALPAVRSLIAQEQENYTNNLVIVNMAGLTDLALFMAAEQRRFEDTVSQITLMGGYAQNGGKAVLDEDGYLMPDSSKNNAYDKEGAGSAYSKFGEHGLPVRFVTPALGNKCVASEEFRTKLAQIGCPVATRLATSLNTPGNEAGLYGALTLFTAAVNLRENPANPLCIDKVVHSLFEPSTEVICNRLDEVIAFLESQILEALQ